MSQAMETLFKLAKTDGISDSELARRIGVSREYIYNIKKRGISSSIDKYMQMSEALGYEVVLIDRSTGLKIKL